MRYVEMLLVAMHGLRNYYRDRSWVKLTDVTQTTVGNQISSHLQSRLVYYLMNMHIKRRNIYICRHGESKFNVEGRVGGDSELSENGKKVCHGSKRFARTPPQTQIPLIWSNTLIKQSHVARILKGCTHKRSKLLFGSFLGILVLSDQRFPYACMFYLTSVMRVVLSLPKSYQILSVSYMPDHH